jgi:hypothetical protein
MGRLKSQVLVCFSLPVSKSIRISVVYFPDSRENYELLSGILIAATGLERVEIRLQPQCPFQGYKSGRRGRRHHILGNRLVLAELWKKGGFDRLRASQANKTNRSDAAGLE